MKAKLLTTCLLASVFTATVPSIVSAQSSDIRCEDNSTLLGAIDGCDPDNIRKLNVDPSTTGSVDSANGVSNSKSSNDGDDASTNDGPTSADSPSSADDGGSTAGDDDHDNGHGNDADHDDSSNPGKGGGNHGAGK